jgi:hypothetical protein
LHLVLAMQGYPLGPRLTGWWMIGSIILLLNLASLRALAIRKMA